MKKGLQSKTIEFFDDLYTYPPKFRVKWDTIDELHEDLFMSYNYRVLNDNDPFMDVLTGESVCLNNVRYGGAGKIKYSLNSYIGGYLKKITSTKFRSWNVRSSGFICLYNIRLFLK